jgi:hypothetical protein
VVSFPLLLFGSLYYSTPNFKGLLLSTAIINRRNNAAIDPRLIGAAEFREPGYRPLIDFGARRVAALNGLEELLPHNFPWFQKREQTFTRTLKSIMQA